MHVFDWICCTAHFPNINVSSGTAIQCYVVATAAHHSTIDGISQVLINLLQPFWKGRVPPFTPILQNPGGRSLFVVLESLKAPNFDYREVAKLIWVPLKTSDHLSKKSGSAAYSGYRLIVHGQLTPQWPKSLNWGTTCRLLLVVSGMCPTALFRLNSSHRILKASVLLLQRKDWGGEFPCINRGGGLSPWSIGGRAPTVKLHSTRMSSGSSMRISTRISSFLVCSSKKSKMLLPECHHTLQDHPSQWHECSGHLWTPFQS